MRNLKRDFPIFRNHPGLVYLDNAATSQKPYQVLRAMDKFYRESNSNVGRSIYPLAEAATLAYESAREEVAQFIGAAASEELIFTSGATASLNLIARAWGDANIEEGDEIVLSELEHHSNLIPWQKLCKRKRAKLRFIRVNEEGDIDQNSVNEVLNERTKLVAITHVSNAIGTVVNVEDICRRAKRFGSRVLIDASQSYPHGMLDVSKIGCDFAAFSGHKALGPTGVGGLYIRSSVANEVPPISYGGGMVYEVSLFDASWSDVPHRYEAGTPPIAEAVGMGAAIRYFREKVSVSELDAHLTGLVSNLIDGLDAEPRVRPIGPIEKLKQDGHIVGFVVDGIHPHDVAARLGELGVCVRAGHHCAQPLHTRLGVPSTIRASFYLYNSSRDVARLLEGIRSLIRCRPFTTNEAHFSACSNRP